MCAGMVIVPVLVFNIRDARDTHVIRVQQQHHVLVLVVELKAHQQGAVTIL